MRNRSPRTELLQSTLSGLTIPSGRYTFPAHLEMLGATDTRTQLLRAAARVVARDGVKKLTLESVAKEAQVSKGGLLYHFSSKPQLISALVEDLVTRFDGIYTEHARPGEPGARTRAYIQATLDERSASVDAASAGVLAAVASDPQLLRPLRLAYRRWHEGMLDDGIDPVCATIVRLAMDGLWFSRLLGILPIGQPLLTQIIDRLESLATLPEDR